MAPDPGRPGTARLHRLVGPLPAVTPVVADATAVIVVVLFATAIAAWPWALFGLVVVMLLA